MTTLNEAFEAAKKAYPKTVKLGNSRWGLVEGASVSGIKDHAGKWVLEEHRQGCRTPFHHWGFFVRR